MQALLFTDGGSKAFVALNESHDDDRVDLKALEWACQIFCVQEVMR